MPRSRNLAHYPARYAKVIRECAVRNISSRLTFQQKDKGKALSMRGHFYAYIGVLKGEARRIAGKTSVPSAGEQDIAELAKQAEMVMLTVEEESNGIIVLTWQNREHSWQALALKRIESEAKDEEDGLDETASRLLKIQQENEDGKA